MNKDLKDQSEVARLRKELVHSRQLCADLQEELEEKTNLYIRAIQERDTYKEKLSNAGESINRVEEIVQSKVKLALEKERKDLARLTQENQMLLQRLEISDQEKLSNQQREKTMQDKIQDLTKDLQFYARNADMRECMNKIDILRAEKNAKDQKEVQLLQEINKKSNELESALAENRTLRKMANVPQNYGIDAEQIKFLDREKIDDYKKLIRVLQEDNYRLEEERAKLKHMLKQQSMLYKTDQPQARYKNLTAEQLFKVDQYVLKLLAGETEEPADFYKLKKENQILKAQLEILNTKGFDFAKAQVEAFLKELGLGESGKFMEKIMSGNEELKKMIRDLLSKGFSTSMGPTASSATHSIGVDMGRFRPPQPTVAVDGEINSGFSFKFQNHLEVVDKDGKAGLTEQSKYDVAFLQLQLIEVLELVKRKDEDLLNKSHEIEALYKKIRDYLLVQDQLYKDFVRQEKDYNNKHTELQQRLRAAQDSLYEEQHKVKALESALQEIEKRNPQSIENRLIELTKQNSLLDINMLRLTRKYQTLEEQEQLLRRDYHNKEADLAEKDKHVQQRINLLREWKSRAIQQLKFLFNKLKLAVPLTEFQSILSEDELLKQKNADYIDRNSKLAEKLSKMQTKMRQNMEAEERLKVVEEMKEDLENDYEVLKKRLELVDQAFKWENAVFNKIVATLKKYKVSPQQAFEEFDANKDGKLNRQEFMRGLEMMNITDLSNQELDVLMSSIDYDSDGMIKYREFVRKLSRHGVKSRSKEEQIMYLIVDSLRKAGIYSMDKAFALFDKENRGTLSREDFKDVFKNTKVRIDEAEIDRFIDNFWKDKKAGIDYQEFLRIFSKYQVRLDLEDQKNKQPHDRVPDEVLRTKKEVFRKVKDALDGQKKSINDLFRSIDSDKSNYIELTELQRMFERMKVPLNEKEVRDIFNSIDFDMNGRIAYAEFMADFENTVKKDIMTLIREELERVEGEKYARSSSFQTISSAQPSIGGAPGAQNQVLQLQTKVAILETREKQLAKKLDSAKVVLNHAQQAQLEVQNQYDQLEKKWNELVISYQENQQKIREMQEDLRQSIPKQEAMNLKEQNEHLKTEIVETKAAMITYKNMTEVVSDQVKGLKLAMERKKDENENLINAVREISAQSEDQKRLGKLYYLVMLSRWQEAAVNKKYDMVLTENRELRRDLLNSEQLYQRKEYDHHEAENQLQTKHLEIEKLKRAISDSRNIFLTIEKADQLNRIIVEISDEKTELEEQFFVMRTKFRTIELQMDEAIVKEQNAQEMLEILQKSKQSELSDRMLELSNKIQGIRLEEMRAKRERDEHKEKNTYLSRLMRQTNDQVIKLEQMAAEYESRMHKREEEFRRQDNERMKRFFAARFDDIPGAFNEQRKPGTLIRDSENFGTLSNKGTISMGSQRGLQTKVDHNLYEEPNYIKQQTSQSINTTDSKFLEGKVKKLEQELVSAVEKIREKEAKIKMLSDWQLADKYIGEEEYIKDMVEKGRHKTNQVHEQESKEMAEAAGQMVQSLQNMLEQKSQQLKTKDEIIEQLKEQMKNQSERDNLKITELIQKNSITANSALSKLQTMINREDNRIPDMRYNAYDNLTREELSKHVVELQNEIQQAKALIKGQESQIKKNQDEKRNMLDRIADLQYQIEHERRQEEVQIKIKEIEKLKKEIHKKDQLNANLTNTVKEVRDQMMQLSKQHSDDVEGGKMQKMAEEGQFKQLRDEIKQKENKLKMIEKSRANVQEELKQLKVKVQELIDEKAKYILEKDELQKINKATKERLDEEMRKREKLQIQLNELINQNRSNDNGRYTYEQLQARNKELERDIQFLEAQKKVVVVYNKEMGTFEYIGQPLLLNFDKELTDIDEMLDAMKNWFRINNRITYQEIFQAIDRQRVGSLTYQQFEEALLKMGIQLRNDEKKLIRRYLDPRDIGDLNYMKLVLELKGIPQIDFINKEVYKLATKLVDFRDITPVEFKQLIDPHRNESMNLTQLQESIKHVNNDQFQMGDQEVEALFKYVTKSLRTIGVSISIDKLTERVFAAHNAYLIEKMVTSIQKSPNSVRSLVESFDHNKDEKLEYAEFENMLLSCQMAFKPNSFARLCNILDPNKRANKITLEQIKFFVTGTIQPQPKAVGFNNLTNKQQREQLTRKPNVKKLSSQASEIQIELEKKDSEGEGILSSEVVKEILIQHGQQLGVTRDDVDQIMSRTDKLNRGFVSIPHAIEVLIQLSIETKGEISLRNFAKIVTAQKINLRTELLKYDTTRTGKLDKLTFYKSIKNLGVATTDELLQDLFAEGEDPAYQGLLDIKAFVEKVIEASKYKASLQKTIQKPTNISSKVNTGMAGSNSEAFENWEAEKKYKKKLEALQQQIEESKKDAKDAEKLAKHWQEVASKLEKEKVGLQGRLVDINAKPPKAAAQESNSQSQIETIQQLKDQVFSLQEENLKLERIIQVDLKGEMKKLSKDNESVTERLRHYQDEARRQESQVQRLLGMPPKDKIEQREEGELWRELKIQELEKEVQERENRERELGEQLFQAETKLLELRFQKETFDLQYGRLQKRITDLEQYKLASSKFSAVLKNKEEEEMKDNEEKSNTMAALSGNATQSKKNQDSVKLRSKASKTVGELEMLVESLKRVIEKQKVENEQLKKQMDQHEKHQDKLKSEKQLRQKIESLEQEVHAYEMKDVNMDEKDRTIKKLIEANRQLREDLKKEAERYGLIENKYKDLLVKYNVLAKENAKNAEMLFSMNTGGQIRNHDNYLERSHYEDKKRGERSSSKGFTRDNNYERNFEDVY